MVNASGARKETFKRARVWLASVIALVLGALAASFVCFTPQGRALELAVSDELRAAAPLDSAGAPLACVTVEIDDASITQAGRWPWPRTLQADLLRVLADLGARLVVLDIEYAEPQRPAVQATVGADGSERLAIVREPDRVLADAVAASGVALVPFSVYLADRPGAAGGDACATVPPVLARHAVPLEGAGAADVFEAEGFHPMVPLLSDACLGSGYTSFIKDDDHTVRRVPLVVRGGGQAFPHLALEMTGLALFGPDYRLRLDPGRLQLLGPDGQVGASIPVGPRAQLNLRWPRSLDAMHRISARPLLRIVEARHELAGLDRRWREAMATLDALFPDHDWAAADRAVRVAGAAGDAARLEAARAARGGVEERLAMALAAHAGGDAPASGADGLDADRRRAAEALMPLLMSYHEQVDASGRTTEAWMNEARPHVQGRVAVVGLNATGISDQHRTPIALNQPGVPIYPVTAQVILSGVAFQRLPMEAEWVLAVAAAWLAALATVRLPTWWAIAATLNLSVALFVVGWVGAKGWAFLLPVAGPVLAVVVGFAGVSAYRQLTESSSRRWITGVLKQYVSGDHVEEIVRQPERLRLGGERRDITVLFSDIRGFTPLSESLPPERLVSLLNHYLSSMTDILLADHGTLDKYEGDGIMAFFGAPVATPDHALRAVRAALRMHERLEGVNAELRGMGLLPEDRAIAIRVGCSTGPAIVGNFGSERRFDYTAMGDTVNLGGRLEEANRWVGSRVLVPEATRAACGDAVLFRPFGTARIRGLRRPIPLYEPLALEPAPDEMRRVAEAYARAVRHLVAGEVEAGVAALDEILAVRPADEPSQFLKLRFVATQPGETIPPDEAIWNLAKPK